jgi:hypothetical protein
MFNPTSHFHFQKSSLFAALYLLAAHNTIQFTNGRLATISTVCSISGFIERVANIISTPSISDYLQSIRQFVFFKDQWSKCDESRYDTFHFATLKACVEYYLRLVGIAEYDSTKVNTFWRLNSQSDLVLYIKSIRRTNPSICFECYMNFLCLYMKREVIARYCSRFACDEMEKVDHHNMFLGYDTTAAILQGCYLITDCFTRFKSVCHFIFHSFQWVMLTEIDFVPAFNRKYDYLQDRMIISIEDRADVEKSSISGKMLPNELLAHVATHFGFSYTNALEWTVLQCIIQEQLFGDQYPVSTYCYYFEAVPKSIPRHCLCFFDSNSPFAPFAWG